MKNIRNNTWYILSKTWKYEKRLIIIILFQIMIGVILPLATAVLPAWIVDAIGNGMNHITIARLAVVIILLMICNTAVTYIASIQETYLLFSMCLPVFKHSGHLRKKFSFNEGRSPRF